MKAKKIFMTALTVSAAALLLTACDSGTDTNTSKESTTTSSTEKKVDLNKLDLPQLDEGVTENEYLVEIVTGEGSIKLKLFPELAPKAVENFVTHAKDGYYDGVTFHRVIEDFMIQSGDPKGDGTGGESIWGDPFENETSKQLYHIRGAISYANAGPDTNGSQFFIVQNHDDVSDGLLLDDFPEKIIEAYKDGGAPNLDGSYSVFGQVTEGMDVVDKIAQGKVEAGDSGEESKPVDPVKIEKINILQEPKA